MNKPQSLSGDPRRQPQRIGAGGNAQVPRLPPLAPLGWESEAPLETSPSRLDVAGLWRALVRHAGLVALGMAVALAIGAAVTLLTRPTYTAETTIQIDREAEKVVSTTEQTPIDNLSEEFFQTQYGLLKSRALAARVAESLNLIGNGGFMKTMSPARPTVPAKAMTPQERRSEVIDMLQEHEGVTPERGSRLVAVSFDSPDPALSARVANAFAENFIAAALDRRFESSSYARDFLEKRLAQVKAKLEESERDLVAYAASQQIIQLPTNGQPNTNEAGPSLAAANLESFNSALAAAKTERIRAEQKWRQAQGSAGAGFTDILQSPTFQNLSQERAKRVAEYEDKLRVFKPDYPDMVQLKARIDETDRQIDLEAANIRQSLRNQYEAALANEKALSGQVSGLKSAVLDLRGRSIRYTILQREVDTNRTLYDGLLQRYKEVGVAGGVSSNNISIIDRAEASAFPSHPKPLLNMAVAALAGILLGVVLAFLREAFDQAIRTPADIENQIDLPMLGAIPLLKKAAEPRLALADSRSHMAEAYHSLRSALQFSTADGFPKTLMVTSPWPGGGKTTTAFAIAQYVGRLGFRVLLVDGDLRNPSIRRLVEVEEGVGLSSLLTGAASLKEAVQATAYANLFVVTSGPPAPNPAELLSGSRLPLLVAEATAAFDMIVFDGPPIMGLADAPVIGSVVAGCLLVVEAGRATRTQVRQALGRLAQAGAHVLGTVLTKYKTTPGAYGYGYGSGYGYGYGHAFGDGYGQGRGDPGAARTRGLAGVVSRARRLISH